MPPGMLVPCASAVREGDANEVSVSVWHTRRLRTWGKVAGQSTGLGAVSTMRLAQSRMHAEAPYEGRFDWRGRSGARPDRAGVGTWWMTPSGVNCD